MEHRALDEQASELVDDGFQHSGLPERIKLALAFTDAFLASSPLEGTTARRLCDEFTPIEMAEMALGLVIFNAFSKFLIVTGCEPEEMDVTELTAPQQGSTADHGAVDRLHISAES